MEFQKIAFRSEVFGIYCIHWKKFAYNKAEKVTTFAQIPQK